MPRPAPGSGPAPGAGRPAKPRSWNLRPAPAASTTAHPAPAIETSTERQNRYEDGVGPFARRAPSYRLGNCLLYPLVDGPGVAMLVFLPPFLWLMSIPVFDVIAALAPRGEFSALALLVVPLTMPLVSSFALSLGYVVLFLGHVLVASALGESDHPNWPEWDSQHIMEGLGRLVWGALIGVAIGGIPVIVYWLNCGEIDLFDEIMLAGLLAIGAGYAQVAIAAALLHDKILAANPVTAVQAISRIGWRYLYPCVVMAFMAAAAGGALYVVLFNSASLALAAVGLWGFWLLAIYGAMVVARILGLTYYRHALGLGWFRARPAWASSSRTGRIYANS